MTASKRRQVLKIIDWSEDDAWARYKKLYRLMLGEKKDLSQEEIECVRAVRRAQRLVKNL